MVPRMLSNKQKATQKTICQDLLHYVNEDSNFLDKVVSPPDFFLLQRIKSMFKANHYDIIQAVQHALTKKLNSIPVGAIQEPYEN